MRSLSALNITSEYLPRTYRCPWDGTEGREKREIITQPLLSEYPALTCRQDGTSQAVSEWNGQMVQRTRDNSGDHGQRKMSCRLPDLHLERCQGQVLWAPWQRTHGGEALLG